MSDREGERVRSVRRENLKPRETGLAIGQVQTGFGVYRSVISESHRFQESTRRYRKTVVLRNRSTFGSTTDLDYSQPNLELLWRRKSIYIPSRSVFVFHHGEIRQGIFWSRRRRKSSTRCYGSPINRTQRINLSPFCFFFFFFLLLPFEERRSSRREWGGEALRHAATFEEGGIGWLVVTRAV